MVNRTALESERETIRLRAVAIYFIDKDEWNRLGNEIRALTRRIVALPQSESEVVIVAVQLQLFEL